MTMRRVVLAGVILMLWPLAASAQQPGQSLPQESFERCVEDWKSGPAAIYGPQDGRFRLETELPGSCQDRAVTYVVAGRDRDQLGQCGLAVLYGSGGDSETVTVRVEGLERKTGEVVSYAREAVRRVRVRCTAPDQYRPFDLRVCVRCGAGAAPDEAFGRDLEKFLKQ